MSYLLVIVIAAIVGYIAGQYLKGSEHGAGVDAAAGAAGGAVFVALSRAIGPASAAGYAMSTIVAVLGSLAAVYATRLFLKSKAAPAPTTRKRY